MARRRRATKRKISPDPVYKSVIISKFINKVMLHGEKRKAQRIVYGAIDKFATQVGAENPVEAFEKALENATPKLEVKSRRIGGATYQVPTEISEDRSCSMAMKWVILFSRQKPGKSMIDSLIAELTDCYNNQGPSVKKKEETHRMAEANKAFAHYRA